MNQDAVIYKYLFWVLGKHPEKNWVEIGKMSFKSPSLPSTNIESLQFGQYFVIVFSL